MGRSDVHSWLSILMILVLTAVAAGVIVALATRASGGAWKSRRMQGLTIGVCTALIVVGVLLIMR